MGQDDDNDTRLNKFGASANWQLGHEKHASMFFATLALTSFCASATSGGLNMKNTQARSSHSNLNNICASAKLAPQLWKICKHIFRSIQLNSFSTFIKMLSTYIL
jgi:hypothetical protein